MQTAQLVQNVDRVSKEVENLGSSAASRLFLGAHVGGIEELSRNVFDWPRGQRKRWLLLAVMSAPRPPATYPAPAGEQSPRHDYAATCYKRVFNALICGH